MSNNIIDKIQLSGVTYDIGGQGGSGVSVVEVTQAEYDALPTSAKTDTSKMYVITDAQAGDLTNYYTKTETNTLLGGKQDTLVSGTNIKTINNESILGSGNIDIQGGSITIDSSFNRDSENAISNKVVSRGTIGSYGLSTEGSGANARNILQVYDQGGYGVSNLSIPYTRINNKPVIANYAHKTSVPYNIDVVETSAITTSISSSSTDAQVPSAKAVYDQLGGLKLVKLSQSEYDALATKDSNTLFVIVN